MNDILGLLNKTAVSRDVSADYSADWKEYRGLRRNFFLVWFGYVPGVGAFAFAVNFLFHTFVPGFIFAGCWGVWFLIAANRWALFDCPRCGKTFGHREGGLLHPQWGPLARKCMNCGLRKFAEFDSGT